MKKAILLLIAFGIILCTTLIPVENIYSNASAPPPGYTSAPGDQSCAKSGCHSNSSPRIDSAMEITSIGAYPLNSGTGYIPGQLYNLSVNGGQGFAYYGFELTVVDSAGNGIDSFSLPGSHPYVSLSTSGSRQYVGHHNAASGIGAWNFNWTAPQTTGSLYFYVTFVTSNDTLADNDIIKNQKYKLTTSSFNLDTSTTDVVIAGINQVRNADEAGIAVFPNPVKDQLNISYVAPMNTQVKADVYDLEGKLVLPLFETTGQGHADRLVNVGGQLATGIYIVRMSIGANDYFKKIMVQQ